MHDEVEEQVFDLKVPLSLPPDTCVFTASEAVVACSALIARWVVVAHPLGPQLLSLLLSGATPEDALLSLGEKHDAEDANDALSELLSEIVDKDFRKGAAVQTDLVPSPYATLSMNVTNACNLRCITCYRFSGEPDPDELQGTEWLRLISEHDDLGGSVVKISGGEPLHRDSSLIFDIIREAKKRGMWVLLLSNGTLIDNGTALSLADAGLDRVQISLDGPDEETNDRVRGAGVYASVMRSLEILCDLTTIDVYLAILPVPDASLEALQEKGEGFARNLKKRFGSRITVSVSQGMLDGRDVCHDESVSYMKVCRHLQNRMGSDMWVTAGHDLWQWEPGRRNLSCGYGRTLGVEPNGTVKACAGGEVVGNVRESSLQSILKKLEGLALDYTVDGLAECADCVIRYLCGGPCRVRPEPCSDVRKLDLLDRLVRSNSLRYEVEQDV